MQTRSDRNGAHRGARRGPSLAAAVACVVALGVACNEPAEDAPVDLEDREGLDSPIEGTDDWRSPPPVGEDPDVETTVPGAVPGPGADAIEEEADPGGTTIPSANTPNSSTTVAPGGPGNLGPGGPPG